MNLLTIKGVRGYIDTLGTAQLNLEDVSRGLGFIQKAASGNQVVRWERVNKYLSDFGFIPTSGDGFIPESIFYRLAMKAKNDIAEEFQIIVAEDILPSIRKHGAYMTPVTLEKTIQDPEYLIGIITALKNEQDTRKELEQKIEQDKPKTIFADAVSTSNDSILVGQLATILKQNGVNIGQTRLFNFLREEGYLCKSGERRNLPTQKAMELKLFEVKEFTVHGNSGIRVKNTPKVTGRGQIYFINKFLKQSA